MNEYSPYFLCTTSHTIASEETVRFNLYFMNTFILVAALKSHSHLELAHQDMLHRGLMLEGKIFKK